MKHNEIDKQLKLFIINKKKNRTVRRVAIEIALACDVNKLQNILADIALDDSEDIQIRSYAAMAVANIADDNTRLRLKPLATDPQIDDVDDELKGAALIALWPGLLDTHEMFNLLTPQKRSNLFANYASFLYDIPERLKIEDFPIALKWISDDKENKKNDFSRYDELDKNILFEAWNYLIYPEILEAYVDTAIPRLYNYESICPTPMSLDKNFVFPALPDEIKKNLIKSIVIKIKKYKNNLLTNPLNKPKILFESDIEWLIDEFYLEKDKDKIIIWAEIIHDLFVKSVKVETINLILNEINKSSILNEIFLSDFEAIPINSEKAKKTKEIYYDTQRWENEEKISKQEKFLIPSVSERILILLDKFEKGEIRVWIQICREMTLENTSKFYGNIYDSDLTKLPGWDICNNNTRHRIINAAKKYILDDSISTVLLADNNKYYTAALAGYKAILLLKKLDPSFLDNLESYVWKRWASVIIQYPEETYKVNHDKTYLKIIKQAYIHTPQEIISALLNLIDRENNEYDTLHSLRKIENCKECLDERMQNALIEKLKDSSLKVGCFQDILLLLLSINNSSTINYAKSFIVLPIKNEIFKKAIAATISLMRYGDISIWNIIWDVIQSDIDFGRKVFLSFIDISSRKDLDEFIEKIGEKNTVNLFIWLFKKIPGEKDKKNHGWIDEIDKIDDFRSSILHYFENAGTSESIEALQFIRKNIPEYGIIDIYIIKARENTRQKKWIPLQPSEFLSLIKNSNKRIILYADHLQDILIESLNRLENKLQGETSQAFALWDEQAVKSWKPKEEKYLSDYVKDHFEDDLVKTGIISSREVEISNKQGNEGKEGEEIDIYVSYFIPSKQEKVTVIIEVKGCWNQNVKTDIKNQLLDRYLDKPDLNHGIYLVGWYMCKQWKEIDSKRNKTRVKKLEDAKEKFQKLALELSTNQKIIKSYVLNCALREK